MWRAQKKGVNYVQKRVVPTRFSNNVGYFHTCFSDFTPRWILTMFIGCVPTKRYVNNRRARGLTAIRVAENSTDEQASKSCLVAFHPCCLSAHVFCCLISTWSNFCSIPKELSLDLLQGPRRYNIVSCVPIQPIRGFVTNDKHQLDTSKTEKDPHCWSLFWWICMSFSCYFWRMARTPHVGVAWKWRIPQKCRDSYHHFLQMERTIIWMLSLIRCKAISYSCKNNTVSHDSHPLIPIYPSISPFYNTFGWCVCVCVPLYSALINYPIMCHLNPIKSPLNPYVQWLGHDVQWWKSWF